MKFAFYIFTLFLSLQGASQDRAAIKKIDSLLLLQAEQFKETSETITAKTYYADSSLATREIFLLDRAKRILLFTLTLRNKEYQIAHGINQYYILNYYLHNQLVKTEVYCTRCQRVPNGTFYYSHGKLISKDVEDYFIHPDNLLQLATKQLKDFTESVMLK